MKLYWLYAILILWCLPFAGVCQSSCNLSIRGVIIDEHDNSSLAFSTVYIPILKKGVAADEEGRFTLNNLCPQQYTIVISHIGCRPDTVSIDLKRSIFRTFYLEHHSEELIEIEVAAQKNNTIVERNELKDEEYYENTGKSFGELLKSINGVNSLQTGANISKPLIGGLTNNRIQIMNQGVQLQSQQWGDEHAPEIDPFAAANYTVVKGAGAVKYTGGAIGGLVIVQPDALPRKPGIGGELNSLYATNNRMLNSSLMLEGSFKNATKFAWRAQGSWKKSGNIKTPDYYQKNTGVQELNGSLDIGYFDERWNARIFYSQFNSEIGIFSGAHIGNLTDLQNAINRKEPRVEDREGFSYKIRRPSQLIEHELSKVEFNRYMNHLGKINIKLSRQFNIREEFDKERPRNEQLAALDIPEFSLSLESYTTVVGWELPEIKNWKTELGINWVDIRNSVNSFRDFIPDYTGSTYSFYFIEEWRKNKLELELGFRFDRSQLDVNKLINREFTSFQHDYNALTMHLGAAYEINKLQSLAFNLTFAERPPAINELYSDGLHHGTASLEFGDNSLSKESSLAVSASYRINKSKWKYNLYGYYKRINDFIFLDPTGLELTIRGAFPSYSWQNTDALIRGFDQTTTVQFVPKLSLTNKLSFIWGNNIDADNFLINMPSNRVENNIRYTTTLFNTSKKLTLWLGSQYVFRQNRFNKTQEIAEPPAAYHLLNAGVTYNVSLKEEKQIEFGIRGDNLLNEIYRDYLNRFRFFSDEQGRNITIRINYQF